MEREGGVKDKPLVIKFGGTSVGDGAAFSRAARIAAEATGKGPVAVVVSAMSGATDALLRFAEATNTTTRERSVMELCRTLADRHLTAAREAVPEKLLSGVEERLRAVLEGLTEAVETATGDPAARKDAISSFGERLSAEVLAGAIGDCDVPAAVVGGDPIATNGDFGEARVLVEETRRRVGSCVRPLLDAGFVAVAPGYIGRGPYGAVTTLGRGGSDLSATVLGRALGSREVWIMSDVDGVLSADPCLIPDAVSIRYLSYREAARFASLGAKILHPDTIAPAAEAGIEVHVRSTFDPGSSGTRIRDREDAPGLRGLVLRRDPLGAEIYGVGALTNGERLEGLRFLREAGVRPVFSGDTAGNLLFVVEDGVAEVALRALHAGLIEDALEDDKEVA